MKKLIPSFVELLSTLAEAQPTNDGWVSTGTMSTQLVPYHIRKMAQDRGWIEARGDNARREFKITARGLTALGSQVREKLPVLNSSIGDNGTAIEAANVQPAKTSRLSDEEKADMIRRSQERVISKKTEPAAVEKTDEQIAKIADAIGVTFGVNHSVISDVTIQDAMDECAADCNDCLYKEVVSVLEKRVPGVRDLVAGFKAISRK